MKFEDVKTTQNTQALLRSYHHKKNADGSTEVAG
jgi:hypothetical protein